MNCYASLATGKARKCAQSHIHAQLEVAITGGQLTNTYQCLLCKFAEASTAFIEEQVAVISSEIWLMLL